MKPQSFLALSLTGLTAFALGCKAVPYQAAVPTTGTAPTGAQAVSYGNVEIRVRWPQRTQAIPLSANALVVQAFDSLGRDAGSLTLRRSDNQDLQLATMRLRAGTYTLEARAYRETDPTELSVPTAMGSQAGVTISTNLKTTLSMTLVAQAPTFGGMSATAGGLGSQFTLDTVRFFNRPVVVGDTVEVWFGWDNRTRVKSPDVQILSRRKLDPVTGINQFQDPEQDKLLVTVPTGLSGRPKVWLKVDGIEVFVGNFYVVDRMVIEPTTVTRQVGEWYDAKTNLQAFALDTAPSLSYPMLTWSSSDPSVAFVTQQGLVYPYKPGTATITARSGSLTTSFTLTATDRHSTASVDVNVPTVNTGDVSSAITMPSYSGDDTGTVNP